MGGGRVAGGQVWETLPSGVQPDSIQCPGPRPACPLVVSPGFCLICDFLTLKSPRFTHGLRLPMSTEHNHGDGGPASSRLCGSLLGASLSLLHEDT